MQTAFAGDSFATAAPPNAIFCHQEFLEKLQEHRNSPIGKRASLLLQRLAVDERRQHFKATHGENRGWRRSRLGGSQGSHFYAWWAPKGAPPFRGAESFEGAPDSAIFVRDIRHHDDHSPATIQSLSDHYLPISVEELRRDEYGPSPWTPPQARFAGARQAIRLLKGHPGSGKTTALLNAADRSGAQRVLYLTFSADLAALARLHFDRYCSNDRTFHIATFQSFLRQFLRSEAPITDEQSSRQRFRNDIATFARYIAPWGDHRNALFDELHAHVVGAALPIGIGRFEDCREPRTTDRDYRVRRSQFVGHSAATAACDAMIRLERQEKASLAERYFPELNLAWSAGQALLRDAAFATEFLDFDCIAVDECQDLTPIEAFVVVQLAATINSKRRLPIPLLLAGDEAQTVRPTDFEWAWMSDLLHTLAGTPSEFKLGTNLRSPRQIARLVNHVWDLYSIIEKRDRPSGTGYADIDDDATDQILYCTASPGAELTELLTNLAGREGLAMVALDESTIAALHEQLRPSVLTSREIKGLDFHTVCVIDAGKQLMQIIEGSRDYVPADLESLHKRLLIDSFRVALSRPTERLIWLDVQPKSQVVQSSLRFLNHDSYSHPVGASIPSAILKTLEEETLDVEDRIRRCEQDARQYLQIKPDLALSRAKQAVALLGDGISMASVTDRSIRTAVHLMAAEICFCLAHRNARLAPELGFPNLYAEAAELCFRATRPGLASIISAVERVSKGRTNDRLQALGDLAQALSVHKDEIEPWLLVEMGDKAALWVSELEGALSLGNNAAVLSEILPPFYDALKLPDAEARKQRLRQRSVNLLVKNRRYVEALHLLKQQQERDPKLEAECLENLGRYGEAAAAWREIGDNAAAVNCYRSIPDFDSALALIREAGDHPAAESYEWLARLRGVIAERPEKFNKTMRPSEKKLLESILEEALGATRKKPAAKKAAAKKAAPKAAVKRPAKRKPSTYF